MDLLWIAVGTFIASTLRWMLEPMPGEHVYYGASVAVVAVVAAVRSALAGVLTALACAIVTVVSWLPGPGIVGKDRVVLVGVFFASASPSRSLRCRDRACGAGRFLRDCSHRCGSANSLR